MTIRKITYSAHNRFHNLEKTVEHWVRIATLFLLLTFMFFVVSLCYSNESVGNFAEYLFNEKDYLRAIGEYQRMSFFSNNSDSVDFYQFRIAECYRKRNDFDKAKNIYDELILKGVRDSELEKLLIISSSICSINRGALEYVRITLKDLEKRDGSSDSTHYLIGVSYLKERKWKEAEEEFDKITSSALKERAFQMLREISAQHFKSPKVALLLSTFIPGAGQIYASKPLQGIISFSLNLSLGYLTYKAVREDRRMDALLIVYFGLQRFYFGNLEQARKYPIEHNQRIIDRIVIE